MIYQHDQPPLDRAEYRRVWDLRIRHARRGPTPTRDLHPDYDWDIALVAVAARSHRADACRERALYARQHPRSWPPEFEDAP